MSNMLPPKDNLALLSLLILNAIADATNKGS